MSGPTPPNRGVIAAKSPRARTSSDTSPTSTPPSDAVALYQNHSAGANSSGAFGSIKSRQIDAWTAPTPQSVNVIQDLESGASGYRSQQAPVDVNTSHSQPPELTLVDSQGNPWKS